MMSRPFYRDRHDAGRALAKHLSHYQGKDNLLVLALPRGGVAVGYEVAHALHAPLDVFVVRKLGLPGHEEYAMGAIASGGVRVMNPLPGITVPPEAVAVVLAKECGHLHAAADEHQISFEIHGLILALHYEARFLKSPGSIQRGHQGFKNILLRYGACDALDATPSLSTVS